jgi:hypothetical protein
LDQNVAITRPTLNLGDHLVTQEALFHVLLCLMVADWWIWTRVRHEQPFRTINKRGRLIRNVIRDSRRMTFDRLTPHRLCHCYPLPRPPFSQQSFVLYPIDTSFNLSLLES